jgi:hypothetical protein
MRSTTFVKAPWRTKSALESYTGIVRSQCNGSNRARKKLRGATRVAGENALRWSSSGQWRKTRFSGCCCFITKTKLSCSIYSTTTGLLLLHFINSSSQQQTTCRIINFVALWSTVSKAAGPFASQNMTMPDNTRHMAVPIPACTEDVISLTPKPSRVSSLVIHQVASLNLELLEDSKSCNPINTKLFTEPIRTVFVSYSHCCWKILYNAACGLFYLIDFHSRNALK